MERSLEFSRGEKGQHEKSLQVDQLKSHFCGLGLMQ